MSGYIEQAESILRQEVSRLPLPDLHSMLFALKQSKDSIRRLLKSNLEASKRLAKEAKQHRRKQFDTSGIRPDLRYLTDKFIKALNDLTERLHSGDITNSDWEDEFQILMAQYGQAGYMTGAGADTVAPRAVEMLVDYLDDQYSFLSDFAIEIQDEEEWKDGWSTRAESYALSIKVPYWNGEVKMLPLPAMPAQGTQCLNNCGCAWRIETLDEESGDYNCYWERSKDDSCQTCIQREADWSPLEIRGGVLQ